MERITITACDLNSSDTRSRTFKVDTMNLKQLNDGIEEFIEDISYTKYELVCNDVVDSFTVGKLLDDFDITY